MGIFISIYSHVLILLVHGQIISALFLNACPDKLMWTLRAKQLCGVKDNYMCLYDTNERSFRELCKEAPEFHRPGNIFVISGNLQYFAGRQCYGNRYQPHKWWTNGSSECQYKKSSCNGEGQVPYDNGTISRDRKCRCDYTNYYTFVNSTKKKCHCNPTEEDCSCYRKRCKVDQVLTPDYDCVGVHEWTGQYVCPEYKQPKITEDKKMQQTTLCPNIKKDLSGTLQQSIARIAVSMTSGVLLILCLMTTVAFIINRNASQETEKKLETQLETKLDAAMKEFKEDFHVPAMKEFKEDFHVPAMKEFKEDFHVPDWMVEQVRHWQRDDSLYIETRATYHVLDCLIKHSCVNVVGPPGCGKTALVRHVALQMNQHGYTLKTVVGAKEIKENYKSNRKTLFIVDDFCGLFTAKSSRIDSWKRSIHDISSILENSNMKLLLTCRLQTFHNERLKRLDIFNKCVCNLGSTDLSLDSEEKRKMTDLYFKEHSSKALEHLGEYEFLPLLCKIHYVKKTNSQYELEMLLANPFFFYRTELMNMKYESIDDTLSFIALLLLVIFNNKIYEKTFRGKEQSFREIMEDIREVYDIYERITGRELLTQLQTLTGTFVIYDEGFYQSIHPKLFDFLAVFFGTDEQLFDLLLKHAKARFIAERMFVTERFKTGVSADINCLIPVHDEKLNKYVERIFKDMGGSSALNQFIRGNRNFENVKFSTMVLVYMEHLSKNEIAKLINTVSSEFLNKIFVTRKNDIQEYDEDCKDEYRCFGIIIPDDLFPQYVERWFNYLIQSNQLKEVMNSSRPMMNITFLTVVQTCIKQLSNEDIASIIQTASEDFMSRMFVMTEDDINENGTNRYECFGIIIPDDLLPQYVERWFNNLIQSNQLKGVMNSSRPMMNVVFRAALRSFLRKLSREKIDHLLLTASQDFINRMFVITEDEINIYGENRLNWFGIVIPGGMLQQYMDSWFKGTVIALPLEDVKDCVSANRSFMNVSFREALHAFLKQIISEQKWLLHKNDSICFLNKMLEDFEN